MDASTAPRQGAQAAPPRAISLLRWVWRAYVRNALVPLLVVELLLVAVYLTSHAWSLRRNVAALSEVARQELTRIAGDESAVIEQQLGQVAALTQVLRRQAEAALHAPVRHGRDRERLRLQPSGALTTWRDDGGAAVFWSARTARTPHPRTQIFRTDPRAERSTHQSWARSSASISARRTPSSP